MKCDKCHAEFLPPPHSYYYDEKTYCLCGKCFREVCYWVYANIYAQWNLRLHKTKEEEEMKKKK